MCVERVWKQRVKLERISKDYLEFVITLTKFDGMKTFLFEFSFQIDELLDTYIYTMSCCISIIY